MDLFEDVLLDTTGLRCPEPVMLLHNKMRGLGAGQVLKLIASDPSTQRDVPKFCLFLEHELLAHKQEDGCYLYWLKKSTS